MVQQRAGPACCSAALVGDGIVATGREVLPLALWNGSATRSPCLEEELPRQLQTVGTSPQLTSRSATPAPASRADSDYCLDSWGGAARGGHGRGHKPLRAAFRAPLNGGTGPRRLPCSMRLPAALR